MAKTKFCQGVSDISDSYMGMIIDLWGVLHDGQRAFPGVVDCMRELRERKKRMILLSNTSERADVAKEKLKKMGIGPSLYDHIVTSGEMIWQGVHEQKNHVFEKIGQKCFLIGRTDQRPMIEGSGVEIVDGIKQADFILIGEAIPAGKTFMDYDAALKEGIKRRLKALCANPDSLALISTNYLMGPGLISRKYEDYGGVVHYIGKPHKPIFRHCVELLQKFDVYPAQTVMIGDTMAHDILGGYAYGIDTCLTKNGLHAASFRPCTTPQETNRALKVLIAQYNNVMPTFLMDDFKWGRSLPDRKHKKRKQPTSD